MSSPRKLLHLPRTKGRAIPPSRPLTTEEYLDFIAFCRKHLPPNAEERRPDISRYRPFSLEGWK
jgi:hypothetical protein